ncbi:MAG TPA: FHA domain-containing protein [Gemmataceae bacterium]|nr:FHA domain-containing protein [Gemmataceae bacterium]
MKVTLAMIKPSNWTGRRIQVVRFPFVIGREPGCDLRADSSSISGRHCAIQVRDDKVFVSEFPGNPTLVNDLPLQGEQELHDQDCIKVGRLRFTVKLESEPVEAQDQPAAPAGAEPEEEAVASLLLSLEEDQDSATMPPSASDTLPHPHDPAHGAEPGTSKAGKAETADTAAAARNLLSKFRKPHSLTNKQMPAPDAGH